jgi:hypothetical protein
VSFDAKASVAGNITLAIGHAGGGWTPYFVTTVAITTALESYEIVFTLDDEDADYSVLAQFKLEMGLLFADLSGPQTFTLADVAIDVLGDDDTFVNAYVIVNGKFE